MSHFEGASARVPSNFVLKLGSRWTSSSKTKAYSYPLATMSLQTLTWLEAHPYSGGVM